MVSRSDLFFCDISRRRRWQTGADARRALDPVAARGVDAPRRPAPRARATRLFQASTIGALLDGEFFRAGVDGRLSRIPPEERTPFAVVTRFEPSVEERLSDEELGHEELLARLEALLPTDASSCAIRLDGRFDLADRSAVEAVERG